MIPPEQIRRYPKTLTDDELERDILSSTPKGSVAGRELHLDFSELTSADFHTVGRLIGAAEGFLRRGGSLRIVPPSTRATADEAQRLAMPTTRQSPAPLRKQRLNLARLVQDRSRASRFLQRVGFLGAARCGHLVDVVATVEAMPPLVSEWEPAEGRVMPTPLSGQGKVLEVVPFQWLSMATEIEFEAVVNYTDTVLSRMGADRRVRQAVHELAQNVYEHSLHGDDTLTSAGSQYMLFGVALRDTGKQSILEILIVDGGVGIPETLRDNFRKVVGKKRVTKSEILAYAFTANSTRKKQSQVEGSARGLAVVLGAIRNAHGYMSVRSDTGEVLLRDGELVICRDRSGFQPGTTFALSIPMATSASPRRLNELDDEVVAPSALDIDAHVIIDDGTSSPLVSMGPQVGPATHEPTIVFVEPGCSRANLERFLVRHIKPNAIVIVAATDGQGSLLRDQVEAILAARPPAIADVLVLDGLAPAVIQGKLEARTARGLIRSIVERFSTLLVQEIGNVVETTPISPRRTWSLEVATRWIEPRQLTGPPVIRVLTPFVLAFWTAQRISESAAPDVTVLDIIVTDNDFTAAGAAVAGWLGARHVRRIRIPQEPDSALLANEIEGASVVLTPVIHGGGATVPIIRGLMASGRRSIVVCCFVDSRREPAEEIQVAGHLIPVVTAVRSSIGPPEKALKDAESDALSRIGMMLEDEGDNGDLYAAIAASPGALSLGHFHSENRAWMSAVISPLAIADPTTPIGMLIVTRLASAIREEVKALCPGAALEIRDLAQPTLLTKHIRKALDDVRHGDGSMSDATVLVDWGALTGDTVVRGALEAAQEGAVAVIVAVGVDRAFQGAHHLLRRTSMTIAASPRGQLPGVTAEIEERQTAISFVSAVDFPRDHRSEVDCPLCATERSLLRLRSMPTSLLNSRLGMLRVRTSSDSPRSETVDAFNCQMSSDDISRFLIWRSILHRGMEDRGVAHGAALRLEGRGGGFDSTDMIALARNLVLNPDLLKRRPWSSPRFRHALAEALSGFLKSNDGLAISSNMARQLVTVLRMASKSTFARLSGAIYSHWLSPDVREEIEVELATIVRDNMSSWLLETAASAVAEFESCWTVEERSPSLGALKSDIARVRSMRQGDPARQFRWHEAANILAALPTHMGLGGATGRLPILLANVNEPEGLARDTLIVSATRLLHQIQRFIEVDFLTVRALIEEELEALVQRGAADKFPNQDQWLQDTRQFEELIEQLRDNVSGRVRDAQRLMDSVISPLSTSKDSKSFASVVLSATSDIGEAVSAVSGQFKPASCLVTGPEMTANVLFPRVPLHDLFIHLIENGLKHGSLRAARPEIRFVLQRDDTDPVHRRLRVLYFNTEERQEPNPTGGLSDAQWGGALAAFGGGIEVLPSEARGEASFGLELRFQRPWGDTS